MSDQSTPAYSIERSVIGPLTTITTFPAWCENYYPDGPWPTGGGLDPSELTTELLAYGADFVCQGIAGHFPKCLQIDHYAFYSPAIYCPSGWATVPTILSYGMTAPDSWLGTASRAISLLDEDETVVFCCPR